MSEPTPPQDGPPIAHEVQAASPGSPDVQKAVAPTMREALLQDLAQIPDEVMPPELKQQFVSDHELLFGQQDKGAASRLGVAYPAEAYRGLLGNAGFSQEEIEEVMRERGEQEVDMSLDAVDIAQELAGAEPAGDVKTEKPRVRLGQAVWHANEEDTPVRITGIKEFADGRLYVEVEGREEGVPFDEIIYAGGTKTAEAENGFQKAIEEYQQLEKEKGKHDESVLKKRVELQAMAPEGWNYEAWSDVQDFQKAYTSYKAEEKEKGKHDADVIAKRQALEKNSPELWEKAIGLEDIRLHAQEIQKEIGDFQEASDASAYPQEGASDEAISEEAASQEAEVEEGDPGRKELDEEAQYLKGEAKYLARRTGGFVRRGAKYVGNESKYLTEKSAKALAAKAEKLKNSLSFMTPERWKKLGKGLLYTLVVAIMTAAVAQLWMYKIHAGRASGGGKGQ